jgi:hypothetical protein
VVGVPLFVLKPSSIKITSEADDKEIDPSSEDIILGTPANGPDIVVTQNSFTRLNVSVPTPSGWKSHDRPCNITILESPNSLINSSSVYFEAP